MQPEIVDFGPHRAKLKAGESLRFTLFLTGRGGASERIECLGYVGFIKDRNQVF